MTVFPRGCLVPNKNEIAKLPLVEDIVCPEAKIAVPPSVESPEPPPRRRLPGPLRRFAVMIFHFMNISMLLILFIAMSVLIYRQYVKTTSLHRYQGYCTIPIDVKNHEPQLIESNYRVMPLRWSSDPDVQVFSTTDDAATEQFLNVLREELDIDGMVEKISVFNNGHQVNFIHDFTNNLTNIVDDDRCFMADLDLELVLVPEAFIASIERGGEFDVTRVRTGLRALLPALRDLRALHALPAVCRARPTYRLRRDNRLVRKRSVDAKPHDYMHFSGKHIHEIEIGNLEEVLQYEKNKTA